MRIRCPHCASTVDVDPETVGVDATGRSTESPARLHGGTLACADCSDAFSVYVF